MESTTPKDKNRCHVCGNFPYYKQIFGEIVYYVCNSHRYKGECYKCGNRAFYTSRVIDNKYRAYCQKCLQTNNPDGN